MTQPVCTLGPSTFTNMAAGRTKIYFITFKGIRSYYHLVIYIYVNFDKTKYK